MAAARRLQRTWHGAVVPLLAVLSAGAFLLSRGAAFGDAAAGALALLRLLAGVAAGGLTASLVAARLVGREASWRDLAGPVAAAAGWAPGLFLLVLFLARVAGAGAASAVYAGVALLVWGVAAGFGIVAGDDEGEPGRLLVGSCLGIGGVLIGLWLALAAPPRPGVLLVRAPVAEPPIRAGDVLLVRRQDARGSGDLLLLRDPRSAEAVLARRRNGTLTPVGRIQVDPEKLQDWNVAGRVFFRLGTGGAGTVGRGEQSVKPSQD